MPELSRLALVTPARLALSYFAGFVNELVKIFACFAVVVFGWFFWSLLLDFTTMGGPTGVGTPEGFALEIPGTRKTSTIARNDKIYILYWMSYNLYFNYSYTINNFK